MVQKIKSSLSKNESLLNGAGFHHSNYLLKSRANMVDAKLSTNGSNKKLGQQTKLEGKVQSPALKNPRNLYNLNGVNNTQPSNN